MATTVTTWNKGKAPAGATGWQLTPDIRAGLESMNVLVPVADEAEMVGLTPPLGKHVGMAATRADLGGVIFVWDGADWTVPPGAPPVAHMGKTAGVQAIGAGLTLITMTASQMLKGGFTFDAAESALVVPVTGVYRVTVNAYATGSFNYTEHIRAFRNNVTIDIGARMSKADSSDVSASGTGHFPLNAGDKINLYGQGFGTNAANAATLGTNGYDGVYLELEYHSMNVAY